jgi:predicted nucleotide-binding protein (sugar kinase/HSP70/actin superfamily)
MPKNKKIIRIGLPRALHFYKYHISWEEFYKQMGFEVIVSPETNQQILKKGVNLAVDESCLSLKIYLGHVDWLKDKVDYIFLPRIVSLHKEEKACTKFMSLNDIVRNTFPGINLIEYTIDVEKFRFEFFKVLRTVFGLKHGPLKIFRAYYLAKRKQLQYDQKRIKEQQEKINNKNPDRPMILIVSHPYTTYDSLLGKPIMKFLESQGVDLLCADVSDSNKSRELSKNISRDLYWTENKELLGSIEIFKPYIDGIIFLMVFPCGPDALVINLCQHKIKNIPLVVITLDELSGEAGLKTRLESFADILKLRKKKNAQYSKK